MDAILHHSNDRINRLPPELLLHIFQYILLDRIPRQPLHIILLPLHLVCKRWIQLFIENPAFWAVADSRSPWAFNKQVLTHDRHFLIDFWLQHMYTRHLSSSIPSLKENLHRARRIYIEGPASFMASTLLGTGHKPELRYLQVNAMTREGVILELAPNGAIPNRLESLILWDAALNWDAIFPSSLKSLALTNTRPTTPRLSHILNIFNSCPELTTLELEDMKDIQVDCSPQQPPINLPHLEMLLLDLEATVALSISNSIVTPSICQFRLFLTFTPHATDLSSEVVMPVLKSQSDYLLCCLLHRAPTRPCHFGFGAEGRDGSRFIDVVVQLPDAEAFEHAPKLLHSIIRKSNGLANAVSMKILGDLPLPLLNEILTTRTALCNLELPPIRRLCTKATGATLKTQLEALCTNNPTLLPDLQVMNFETDDLTETELLRFARGRSRQGLLPDGVQHLIKLDFIIPIDHTTHEELISLLGEDAVSDHTCRDCSTP